MPRESAATCQEFNPPYAGLTFFLHKHNFIHFIFTYIELIILNMKALTIWQPYAQAFALGLKKYETRSWPTKHRGKIAIHASVKPLSAELKFLSEKYNIKDLLFGQVIIIADLTDCILITEDFIKAQSQTEIDFGDWRIGRYAWKLENIRPLTKPQKISGKQGLWNWNEEIK